MRAWAQIEKASRPPSKACILSADSATVRPVGGYFAFASRHCRGTAFRCPGVGLELLGALLDSGAFVGSLDGAEQDGLGGDLVDIPACRLFGLARHASSIGQRLRTFNIGRRAPATRRLVTGSAPNHKRPGGDSTGFPPDPNGFPRGGVPRSESETLTLPVPFLPRR